MKRLKKILVHPEYCRHYETLQEFEKERTFCRHDMEHFLSVARIAYILNLEAGYEIEKEMIYTTALLHDIGKAEQYLRGIPHEQSSVQISRIILDECGFSKEEQLLILSAIATHRSERESEAGRLNHLIYQSDKKSRSCFSCGEQEECNWTADKMNLDIMI